MNIFNLIKGIKVTHFKAGFCHKEQLPVGTKIVKTNTEFLAPRKIDNRDMLLMSSNQGNTPHCAGYATAGYIEFQNWKHLHYPRQVDGDEIYRQAKTIDWIKSEGTTLSSAIKGAIQLGFIKGELKAIKKTRIAIKFAIHQYGVVVSAFDITDEWNYVNGKTGMLNILDGEAEDLGGHAVLLCGYDKDGVYIQNSWGENWGVHGFAIVPWELFDKQFYSGRVIG